MNCCFRIIEIINFKILLNFSKEKILKYNFIITIVIDYLIVNIDTKDFYENVKVN